MIMMSELFIANPTKQHNHFFYQIPETVLMQNIVIPAGGQVVLPGRLTRAQLQGVVDQHCMHGMIKESEVSKTDVGKILLIYSWDKPVRTETIDYSLLKNDVVSLDIADNVRVDQTAAMVDDLAKKMGAEPETAEVILSEVDNTGGKSKATVVRSVGKK